MMSKNNTLCARASLAATAAAMAYSPVLADIPKPIVDLSKSPAVTGTPSTPAPKQAPRSSFNIGSMDRQTLELGGGALALLVVGFGGFAFSRRNRRDDAVWDEEDIVAEPRDPLFDEPMFNREPKAAEASAFAWGNSSSSDQDGADSRETWVERAYRGPTPDNPSHSLRTRLKRAAFFDKREREAANKAVPDKAEAELSEAIAD